MIEQIGTGVDRILWFGAAGALVAALALDVAGTVVWLSSSLYLVSVFGGATWLVRASRRKARG